MSADEYRRRAKPRSRPEHGLQMAVIECAALLGWRVHWRPDWQWLAVRQYAERHPWAQKFFEWSDNGFPDLLLIHPEQRRQVYVECKAAGNGLSAKQKEWRAALLASGAEYALWKPRDWDDGVVERILKGERLP